MIFICYPKCTTCQKAKRWLDENGIAYVLRDIKEENPTGEELKTWHGRGALPLRKFFNTSGLLYKSMGLKDRLPDMGEEEMLRLLATDGMLVRRPLLIGEDFVLVGFREAEWEKRLKGVPLSADAPHEPPYEGAKEMLVVEDVDDRDFLETLFRAMEPELPEPKKRRR